MSCTVQWGRMTANAEFNFMLYGNVDFFHMVGERVVKRRGHETLK